MTFLSDEERRRFLRECGKQAERDQIVAELDADAALPAEKKAAQDKAAGHQRRVAAVKARLDKLR